MMKGGDTMYNDTQQALCGAIKNKRAVMFSYDGEMRSFEPYTVYKSSTGKTLIYGFQVNGFSTITYDKEPKNFNVDHISTVEEARAFTPDATYTYRNLRNCYSVICSIELV